jgi:hypothetical protein
MAAQTLAVADQSVPLWALPGILATVEFATDPGFHHERVFCWPVVKGQWVTMTPGGDQYVEGMDDWKALWPLRADGRYDEKVVGEVVQFGEAYAPDKMLEILLAGRYISDAECVATGRVRPRVSLHTAIS